MLRRRRGLSRVFTQAKKDRVLDEVIYTDAVRLAQRFFKELNEAAGRAELPVTSDSYWLAFAIKWTEYVMAN